MKGGISTKRANLIGSVFLVALCSLALYVSLTTLPYTDEFGPGSGFFPVWSSLLLVISGVFWLVEAVRERKGQDRPFIPTTHLKKVLVLLAGLWAAPVLMDILGFYTALALLGLFMVLVVERVGPRAGVLPVAVTMAVIFAIFNIWLHMPFPRGLFI